MSNKKRIYEVVKDLMPHNIKEKETKELKSKYNKQILQACKELGLDVKTTSSSIPAEMVSQILNKANIQNNNTAVTATNQSEKKKPSTEENKAQPSTRIVRRVIRKVESQPEEEITEQQEETAESPQEEQATEEESFIQDTPLVEETDYLPSSDNVDNLEEQEENIDQTNESVQNIVTEEKSQPIIETKKEEKKQESKPTEKPKERKNLSFYERNKNYSTKPQSNFSLNSQPKANFSFADRKNKNNNFTVKKVGQQPLNNKNKPSGQPVYKQNNNNNRPQQPGNNTNNNQNNKTGNQPFRVAKPPLNNQFTRKKSKGPKKPNKQKVLHRKRLREQERQEKPEILELKSTLTVQELAEKLLINETEIIRVLFLKGIMKTITQTLDRELIEQVAQEFNCEVIWEDEEIDTELTSKLKTLVDTHASDSLQPRPPVVTIMGHVDHGKTTLLDSIRAAKKDITAGESGGITQHIGAYQVEVTDHEDRRRKITFLDTPGHEAFTALRARGAQVTDIAILIVSADDGVMPQTIEAISHAKAAGVPIIIAVNKIDKPDANPDMVLGQLAEHDLIVEDYGGTTVCTKISAKEKLNLDDLLAKITLVADIELEEKLKADPAKKAVGAVIEASLSSNKGTVATVLVQSGTLRKGDSVVAGTASGRIRAIFDDNGNEIDEAPPASPVQILGLDSQPQAGDVFEITNTVQEAKAQANKEKINQKTKLASSLESLSSKIREGSVKELPIVIKADVQGSAEALVQELGKLSNDEVSVRIIHCAAGAVNESDINLAATAGAILVNFNSVVDATSSKLAKDNNVSIYTYNIIYQVTDAVKKALGGLLEDERIDIKHGEAEVREIFTIGKTKIAGCSVLSGKMVSGETAKIIRDGKELMILSLTTLKRFKDNVKEVQSGFECGIFLDGFHDYKEGDIIESWGIETKERVFE